MSDVKYIEDGSEVEVVGPSEGGYVVRVVYEDGDTGEPAGLSSPRVVPAVYDSPPVARVHEQIDKARAALAALKLEMLEVQGDLAKRRAALDATARAFEETPEARAIAALIRGEAWWVTYESGGLVAMSHADFFNHMRQRERDSQEDNFQVTLGLRVDMKKRHGRRHNGDLTMKLWPPSAQDVFGTKEEAEAECLRRCREALERYPSAETVAQADRLGVPVPDKTRASVLERQREQARKALTNAEAAMAKARADYEAVSLGAGTLPSASPL